MTTLTYQLSREQLEACRTKLASQGVTLVGDNGDISHGSIQLTFNYKEPTFTIVLVDCGPLPTFIVKHKIDGWMKSEESNG